MTFRGAGCIIIGNNRYEVKLLYLEHDSSKLIYRNPKGALKTNSKLCLHVLVASDAIPKLVECIIGENAVKMAYSYEVNSARMYECNIEMPESSGVLFYCFRVIADGREIFCANNDLRLGGQGKMYDAFPDSLFQITVYDESYKTPDWMKNAVVYQIFPDRFFRSGNTPFHGTPRNWNDEPFYRNDQFGGTYLSNDFFGGTLKGIEEKLPYLKDLGVTAIYLNPIFKAFSNHRYDTSDYENVDETLGTNEDFSRLCKKAHSLGMHIILDGVFSHTGADSKYFNKYGNFDSVGAYQSQESPYYSWYNFTSFPESYESWWGFDTLPNVNELDEKYVDYIIENKNAIIKKWLRLGADGWRLDVADELPDEFIEKMRVSLKKENPDALLIGEVWEDASHKESYGKKRRFLHGKSLDGVMNYVFREAVLDFLTKNDAKLFAMRIASLHENYPKESLYSCMNLISSHDVPRAMTVLSGAPDFRTMSRNAQHDYVISHEALQLAQRRMLLAIVLQMTMVGTPTIYYGDEIGMTGYADPFNRNPFDWSSTNTELLEHTRFFTNLRKDNDCLRTGDYTLIYYVGGTVCYMRSIEDGRDAFGNYCTDGSVMVMVNSAQENQHISLCLDRFGVLSATDILTGEKIMHNGSFAFELAPLSYRVLKLERNNKQCTKIQLTQ